MVAGCGWPEVVPSFANSLTAFNIAVTASQRAQSLAPASQNPSAAATAYATTTAQYMNIQQSCPFQEITFSPLKVESIGAWENQAACVLHNTATAAALCLGQDLPEIFQTLP